MRSTAVSVNSITIMKNLSVFLVICISLSALIGCTPNKEGLKPSIAGEHFMAQEVPPKGSGGIYVFRPLFSQYLSNEMATVTIGEGNSTDLPFGAYTYMTLPPGEYDLSLSPAMQASSLWNKAHRVEVVSGKNTFIAVWATEDVTQNLGMMFFSPTVVAPVVTHDSSNQAVFIETVAEDMAIPALSECIAVKKS